VVTDRQADTHTETDTATNAGKNIFPRFRGDNNTGFATVTLTSNTGDGFSKLILHLTDTADVLGLADAEAVWLDERKPAVGVDGRHVSDSPTSPHLLHDVLHRLTTVVDVADLAEQPHAVDRLEQEAVEAPDGQHADDDEGHGRHGRR